MKAISTIQDGDTFIGSGFGLSGIPEMPIQALRE